MSVTALINPWLEVLAEEVEEGWEGCLAVPWMRGLVPRARLIRYGSFLENGSPIEREVEGFHARVFQHEFNHFNGMLYRQRLADLT